MWDLWWKKAALWQVFSKYFGFLLAKYSSDCSKLVIIQGRYNRSVIASVIVDSVPFHPKNRRANVTQMYDAVLMPTV
jgi:hypothetical protein